LSKPAEIAHEIDLARDLEDSLLPQRSVNQSLVHLTLSAEVMQFLKRHKVCEPLIPLADQIMATNFFSERRAMEYKLRVTDQVLVLKSALDEDQYSEHVVLDTAETWLRSLVDSCVKGYRGRLATEIRRVYRSEEEPQRKRGWWPF